MSDSDEVFDPEKNVSSSAIAAITEQDVLYDLATTHSELSVRMEAAARLTDPERTQQVFYDIAMDKEADQKIRLEAAKKLKDRQKMFEALQSISKAERSYYDGKYILEARELIEKWKLEDIAASGDFKKLADIAMNHHYLDESQTALALLAEMARQDGKAGIKARESLILSCESIILDMRGFLELRLEAINSLSSLDSLRAQEAVKNWLEKSRKSPYSADKVDNEELMNAACEITDQSVAQAVYQHIAISASKRKDSDIRLKAISKLDNLEGKHLRKEALESFATELAKKSIPDLAATSLRFADMKTRINIMALEELVNGDILVRIALQSLDESALDADEREYLDYFFGSARSPSECQSVILKYMTKLNLLDLIANHSADEKIRQVAAERLARLYENGRHEQYYFRSDWKRVLDTPGCCKRFRDGYWEYDHDYECLSSTQGHGDFTNIYLCKKCGDREEEYVSDVGTSGSSGKKGIIAYPGWRG
jgi:hypothetical protein